MNKIDYDSMNNTKTTPKQRKAVRKALVAKETKDFNKALARQVIAMEKPTKALTEIASTRAGLDQLLNMIIRSITLPGPGVPVRFSDAFTNRKTAVGSPFLQLKYPWTGTGTYTSNSTRVLSSADGIIFMFRDYLRNSVSYDPNVIGGGQIAAGLFALTSSSGYMTVPIPSTSSIAYNYLGQDEVPIQLQWIDYSSSAYQPHGPRQYAGTVSGKAGDAAGQFCWFQAGETVTFVLTSSANVTYTLFANIWKPTGILRAHPVATVALVANVANSVQLVMPEPGYYTFVSSCSSTCSVGTNAVVAGNPNSEYWCHRSIGSFEANAGSVESLRYLAGSLLYTNTAPPAGRAGNFVCLQAPKGKSWTEQVASSGYDLVASEADVTEMGIENGFYTFLKPSTVEDFDILSYHDVYQGQIVGSHYPLNPCHDYKTIWMNVPSAGTALQSQGARLIFTSNVEYLTLNSWIGTECPTQNSDEYSKACALIKDVPDVYENPLHLGELWNTVKQGVVKGVQGIIDYGPKILNGIMKYGPAVLEGAEMLLPLLL